jgi:hypothetical protein
MQTGLFYEGFRGVNIMYHAENPLTNKYTRQRACSSLAKSRNRRFAHEAFLRNVLTTPGSLKKK